MGSLIWDRLIKAVKDSLKDSVKELSVNLIDESNYYLITSVLVHFVNELILCQLKVVLIIMDAVIYIIIIID